MKTRVYIGPCKHGRGIFASEFIQKDDLILCYCGPVITLEEALAKGAEAFNPLQIGPSLYIDPEEPGLLVNHSCVPNAGLRSDIFLVALRDIHPNEEITFDYSTTMSEKMGTMQCKCGEASCRGIIGDFHELPDVAKRKYLMLGIVQSFIVNEYHDFASILCSRATESQDQEQEMILEQSVPGYDAQGASSPEP